MRTKTITESTGETLCLTRDQAIVLSDIGEQLTARSRDGRQGEDGGESGDSGKEPTLIECVPMLKKPDKYRVTVRAAIGVIGLEDLRILVKPKIAWDHFLYLMGKSGSLPRTVDDRTYADQLEQDEHFFKLVAQWFVTECENILRKGLARDYVRVEADLATVRGRVNVPVTMRSILLGKVRIRCSYDTFGKAAPLNRLLNHALSVVQKTKEFENDIRQQARRAQARFGDVGEFLPTDLHAPIDTNTRYYRHAVALARVLLKSQGIGLHQGPLPGNTFIFKTADPIEQGIREILNTGLKPEWTVAKKAIEMHSETSRSLNP